MTILAITDSLSLPRKHPEEVSYEQTWPQLVAREMNCRIVTLAIGGGTIADLFSQMKYYEGIQPDIVIIQSGIVDCAPRAVTRFESQLFNKTMLLRVLFFKIIGVKRLRKFRNISYTPAASFCKYIHDIHNRFKGTSLYWINILPAGTGYETSLPGITKRIEQYNAIISDRAAKDDFEVIAMENMPPDGIMSDHHHLNARGHEWLANQICTGIKLASANNY